MTAKQYFDFKCDYLEKKYGSISLPLIKAVYYEAERKFGSFELPEKAKTLDDKITEKTETVFSVETNDDFMTVENLFIEER